MAFAEPEAKADADANYWYGNWGYNWPSNSQYRWGYPSYGWGFPSGFRNFGKRSADAEPEAKADADANYWYGNWGYNWPSYSGSRWGYQSGYMNFNQQPYRYGYPSWNYQG